MYKSLKFKLNIQLFADGEQNEESNNLLSFELLKKENEKLKEELEKLKTECARQFEDIKGVIRSGNVYNGQEEQDNHKKKNNEELRKRLFDDLSKR